MLVNKVFGGGGSASLPEYMSAANFTFNGNVCTGYTGSESDFVIVPKSYSIASSITTYQAYDNYSNNILRAGSRDGEITGTFISPDGTVEKTYTSQYDYDSDFATDFPNGALLKGISASAERWFERWINNAGENLIFPVTCNGVEYSDYYAFEEAYNREELTLPLNFEQEKNTYADGSDINVTSISGSGFQNISTLILQDNIATLQNYVFRDSTVKNIVLSETTTVEQFVFREGTSLQTIPLIDTSNITDMSQMFNQCSSLQSIPQLNTSNVTNMYYTFAGCSSLQTIPLLDTSNVINMRSMFAGCASLQSIPLLDTSNVIDMMSMFTGCSSLQTIPLLDTSSVTNMYQMFYGCSSLQTIPQLDISNVTSVGGMFYNCTSLTNLILKNIKVSLIIGSGTSWGHLLTLDSLINTVKECWDLSSGTQQTLTIGSANLEKIANVYVKLITPTAEQIEQDPYITNKLPCIECESTDEGAMTLTAYAGLKNWVLA